MALYIYTGIMMFSTFLLGVLGLNHLRVISLLRKENKELTSQLENKQGWVAALKTKLHEKEHNISEGWTQIIQTNARLTSENESLKEDLDAANKEVIEATLKDLAEITNADGFIRSEIHPFPLLGEAYRQVQIKEQYMDGKWLRLPSNIVFEKHHKIICLRSDSPEFYEKAIFVVVKTRGFKLKYFRGELNADGSWDQ